MHERLAVLIIWHNRSSRSTSGPFVTPEGAEQFAANAIARPGVVAVYIVPWKPEWEIELQEVKRCDT